MCDAIKETDSKYEQAMQKVEETGCQGENIRLTVCLD